MNYPKPRRSEVKEVLHGVTVADPYRWMEDPDSEETKAFVEAENELSKPFLEKCREREQMRENLNKLTDYPTASPPSKYGDFYYYFHNTGSQNQSVLYRKRGLNGESEVFFDANKFSEDGTVSLSTYAFSHNGKYFCYGLSESGSDWVVLHIKDAVTLEDLPEKIERFKYSTVIWTKDEKGFFYGKYPDSNGSGTDVKVTENQKIFYHRLNTSQEEDILCVEFPKNPKYMLMPKLSDCGNYLFVGALEGGAGNMVFIADVSKGVTSNLPLKTIYEKFDCQLEPVANDGDIFYFRTNKDRPNFGIIKLDINKPDEWTDVIPENPTSPLQWIKCVGDDKFVAGYFEDVVTKVRVFNVNGDLLQTLPFDIGTVNPTPSLREQNEVFFHFTSFLTPATIYKCEVDKAPNAVLEEYHRNELPGISTDDVEANQVFYPSKDGTKIPMFILHKKNMPLDGKSPCLLNVYGGFGTSMLPTFGVSWLMYIKELGFTVAIANVRGGGEYGKEWHDAGRLKNKQNTMDDVHAAAKYLADSGYTKSSLLALMGASNGGMVTTASVNQKPELFGAAIAQVPVTDMFRFHKFTIGNAWISDYGNPDIKEDFEVLSKYSPLHTIPENIDNYPSILVTTADHDNRVVPSHALKFVAELQYRLGEKNKNPLMMIVETNAGHGQGKSISQRNEGSVNTMCFLKLALQSED